MTGPAPFDLDSFLAALPARPGVYRMLGADETILYVGKARHLKNRVSSYFHGRTHADKTLALLGQVKRIEVTVTASETEALLLEFNLIKRHRPRYNVLLKDDKSFPYIHLTAHEFPRLAYYRGTRKLPGRFFGPYPNSVAARETLQLLQKLFRIRPCEDTFFANRSRPCLQHQIGRCVAVQFAHHLGAVIVVEQSAAARIEHPKCPSCVAEVVQVHGIHNHARGR